MVLKSLVIPGYSDSFINLYLFDSTLPAYGILPVKLRLIDEPNSWYLAGSGPEICFPTRNPRTWPFYVTLLDPELYDCTRILLAHPLHIPRLTGYWAASFLATAQHEFKSSRSVKTLCHWHPSEPSDSVLEPLESLCWYPTETPESNLINAAA